MTPISLHSRRVSRSCQCWAVALTTTAGDDVAVIARDQLRDRAAHRVADEDRRRDPEPGDRGGGVAGAVDERELGDRPQAAAVSAVVDREYAVAGLHQRLVGAVPVEVGARDPAVEQHHGRPVAAAVAQEQLAAPGAISVRAGSISWGGIGGGYARVRIPGS